ncbi:MAG TPA: MBL fold metallo-hydrolase [Vicinamibacterales bacterium]
MKRTVILTTIVATGLAVAAAAQFPPLGDAQKVKDNLYVIPGEGGNTAVFVTASGVVLVDTKLAKNGQAILGKVKAVTPRPVTMIINTHTHGDHMGSNSEFPASVEIIAHEHTRANMAKMPELKATPSAMPDRTFEDKLTLGSGADQVDLYSIPFLVVRGCADSACADVLPDVVGLEGVGDVLDRFRDRGVIRDAVVIAIAILRGW